MDGTPAIAMFRAASRDPAYFILIEWRGDGIEAIRDFRHVPYIAAGARFTPA